MSFAKKSRTSILVEGALMVALAYVLSVIPFFRLPVGGSITCFSTLPLVVMSLRHGGRWGVGTAAVYALLQMIQGLDVIAPLKSVLPIFLCLALDYFIAYTIIGFTGPIATKFKNPKLGLSVGILATGFGRFFCSFVSGILIWRAYAPEGVPVWKHSLLYNGAWCSIDVALVLVAALLLSNMKALQLTPQKAPAKK